MDKIILNHPVKPMCATHSPNMQHDYIAHHAWMDRQHKNGLVQKQCPKCKRWFFPSEY